MDKEIGKIISMEEALILARVSRANAEKSRIDKIPSIEDIEGVLSAVLKYKIKITPFEESSFSVDVFNVPMYDFERVKDFILEIEYQMFPKQEKFLLPNCYCDERFVDGVEIEEDSKKKTKSYHDIWAILDFKLRKIKESGKEEISIDDVLKIMKKMEGKTK